MENIKNCPACDGTKFHEFLKSSDYFLTKEEFVIVECESCGLKFTNPRPEEKDISRYYESVEYISHDNKKFGLWNLIYSTARYFSIRKKFNLVRKYSHGKTILDYGCGTGEFLRYCQQKHWESTGFEPNPKPREFATSFNKIQVVDENEIQELSHQRFYIITLWHVLEHIYNLDEVFCRLKKIIKPNGTLVIAIPNTNSWDAMHYKKFWAAYDLPRHAYHFSKKTFSRLAEKYNFTIEKVHPMKLDAFYISRLSENYSGSVQPLIRAIVSGFRSNSFAGKYDNEYSSLIFILKPRID